MEMVNNNSLCTVSSDTRSGKMNKRSQIQNEQKGDSSGWLWGLGFFSFFFWFVLGFFIQDILDSLAFLAKG